VCDVVVLNMLATTKDKSDNTKVSFYQESEPVFIIQSTTHHMKMLGDFIVEICREDIFKRPVRKVHLHEMINDNNVKVIHFVTSKNFN
jgi:hypothetical protein